VLLATPTKLKKPLGDLSVRKFTSALVQRLSELANGKIEKFTLDAMMDMLDKLGFRTSLTLPSNDAGSPPQIVITQTPGS